MLSVLRLLTRRLVAARSPERRAIEVRASVCVWVSIAAPVLRPLPLRAHAAASWGCSPSCHRWSTIPEERSGPPGLRCLTFPLPTHYLLSVHLPASNIPLVFALQSGARHVPSGRRAEGKSCQVERSWDSAGEEKRACGAAVAGPPGFPSEQ